MSNYKDQIIFAKENKLEATDNLKNTWEIYRNKKSGNKNLKGVEPLISTIWSQGCYYNDSTPTAGGPCQHVVTGCVATAMSQVMNYYKFPPVGTGQHSYNSNYGQLTANFGNTYYDFMLMPDTLNSMSTTAQIAQVAQLMSHNGIAVEMNYSPSGSGAYSQDAANAFTHYYNYDVDLSLKHKSSFTDSIWELMVKAELDSLHPLYYDGSGSGGHAFVCDGYQVGSFFHFNWGWNGAYNGYFLLSSLNPGGGNYSNNCGAVFGMKPGVANLCTGITDTLTAASGNISDGSYAAFYNNNISCSWLIKPDNAAIISIEFFSFDTDIGDTLFLYDGDDSQAALLGAYTGNNLPQIIQTTSNSLYVEFVSNAIDSAAGWSAAYRSEYCLPNITYTNIMDTISDGSGDANYNNLTACNWLITDSLNRDIFLEFDEFETEAGYDFVKVYDGADAFGSLLGTFDGYSLPPISIATSGSMFIEFLSDGGVVDQGWSAHYYICGDPSAPFPNDSINLCFGDSVMLTADAGFDSLQWFYNGNNLSISDTLFYVNQAGNYYYKVFQGVCSDVNSSIVNVDVNSIPQPSLGNDTIICNYNSLILSAGSFTSFNWNTGDTTALITIDSNIINQYGNLFFVNVIDSNLCSNSDTINVNLSPCLSIDNANFSEVNIYPNPVINSITIENIETNNSLNISVINSIGKIVFYEIYKKNSKIEINMESFDSGVYFLRIDDGNSQRMFKFIKL